VREEISGCGSDVTPWSLPLQGTDRTHVEQVMAEALCTRPQLKMAAE